MTDEGLRNVEQMAIRMWRQKTDVMNVGVFLFC